MARKGEYTPPAHAHWATKRVFELLNEEHRLLGDVAYEAGVSEPAIKAWRTRNGATVRNMEAVLNTLGYDLEIVKRK